MADPTPEKETTVDTRFSPNMPLSQLTPAYLKKHYLTGIKLIGPDKQELDDDWFIEKINDGIAKVEQFTNVDVLKRVIKAERHDYGVNDYMRYGFLQLFHVPSLSVEEIRAVYPTGQTIQTFPSEWLRLNKIHSQVNLVPTAGTLSQVIIGQGTDYVPLIFARLSYLPHLWEVDYTSGFDPDEIPRLVIEAICKFAIIEMLGVMGDTVYPIGVGSQSLSIDGMSQSRSYAMPAFKARVDRYTLDLGLPGTAAVKGGIISQIRNNHLGVNLASL